MLEADDEIPAHRRRTMSRIRSRNTKPEQLVRKGLHARGLRFRLHRRDLPGTPDLVLPRYRVALFVHGCFWHGHGAEDSEACQLFRWPKTRSEFWRQKIVGNRARDARVQAKLQASGWRVAVIWECQLRCNPDPALTLDKICSTIKKQSTNNYIGEF